MVPVPVPLLVSVLLVDPVFDGVWLIVPVLVLVFELEPVAVPVFVTVLDIVTEDVGVVVPVDD